VNRDNRTTYNQALLYLRQADGMHTKKGSLLEVQADC
jgi:hypothetical protein